MVQQLQFHVSRLQIPKHPVLFRQSSDPLGVAGNSAVRRFVRNVFVRRQVVTMKMIPPSDGNSSYSLKIRMEILSLLSSAMKKQKISSISPQKSILRSGPRPSAFYFSNSAPLVCMKIRRCSPNSATKCPFSGDPQ